MAELAEQVGKMVEHLRSKSTQPYYLTRWATLYYLAMLFPSLAQCPRWRRPRRREGGIQGKWRLLNICDVKVLLKELAEIHGCYSIQILNVIKDPNPIRSVVPTQTF